MSIAQAHARYKKLNDNNNNKNSDNDQVIYYNNHVNKTKTVNYGNNSRQVYTNAKDESTYFTNAQYEAEDMESYFQE